LPDKISDDAVLWIDAQDPSDDEMKTLKEHFELDELNLEELTKEGRRSKIEEHENRAYCFVSFPKQEGFVSEAKMDWLAFVVGNRWIITVHKGYSDITCAVYKKISTHGYFALSLSPSTDILLYIFLDLITNEYFLVSDLVHERLQNLSQEAGRLFRERPRQLGTNFGLEIAKSRDQVLALRQSIGPLREIVGRIARGEFALVSSNTLSRFEDLYDRTISLIDVVDTHREEIHDIGDILINVQTLTTNNIIRVLTIISAIFLPLTLIAGIYGTNFGRGFFIPGSNINFGFYIMIAIMISIAIGLIVIFRRKGWL
jgi:magnesium transporter